MPVRLIGILLLATAALALGQQPAAPKPAEPQPRVEEDIKTRITLEVTRVNLLFTVSDRKGRFVTNLAKLDFEVLEGRKAQNIMEFTAESDLPLRMAILVDTSNSIRDRFRFIQEAAIEFINSVMRPRQDKTLVVSFDTTAELVADLDDNHEHLAKLIRDLRPGGGTSLYDAVFFACRDKLG